MFLHIVTACKYFFRNEKKVEKQERLTGSALPFVFVFLLPLGRIVVPFQQTNENPSTCCQALVGLGGTPSNKTFPE